MASSAHAASEQTNAYRALHDENYSSRYFDFYGCINEIYTVSSNQFFSSLAKSDAEPNVLESIDRNEQVSKESRLSVPYMEREELEKLSL